MTLSHILKHLGFNGDVAATLLGRIWLVVAGSATVIMFPLYLTPVEQGYYFSFGSLLSSQVLFELGINSILLQVAARHSAQRALTEVDLGHGDLAHTIRSQSLCRIALRWGSLSSALFFLLTAFAGPFLFRIGDLPTSHWLGAWWVLCAAVSVSIASSPTISVVEGLGGIRRVANVRLLLSIAGYMALWVALINGFGLWACVATPLAAAAGNLYLAVHHNLRLQEAHKVLGENETAQEQNRLRWTRDILPLQWRTALTWAGGYLMFYVFTPLVFMNQGAAAAGKLGIALSMFSAASTLGMSWIYAIVPQMASKIVRKDFLSLRVLFYTHFLTAFLVTIFSISLILSITFAINHFHIVQFSRRIPSMQVMVMLSFATCVNTAVFSMAAFIRAHSAEPLVLQAITSAGVTLTLTYWSSQLSVEAVAIAYAGVSLLVTLPWCSLVFLKFWRQATPPDSDV